MNIKIKYLEKKTGRLKTEQSKHFFKTIIMRKTFFILSLSFFLLSSKAQIALEHTFNFGVDPVQSGCYVGSYILNNELSFYTTTYEWSSSTKLWTLKLFNSDYSLRKSCSFDSNFDSGYSFNFYYISQKLFNDDDLIEFLMRYFNEDEEKDHMVLINENGEILHKFENIGGNYSTQVVQYQNKTRLIIGYKNERAEIYSLPGKIPNNISENNSNIPSILSPFPNPSYSFINLPYKLEAGKTSVMNIYNINGQLIEKKKIDAFFDVIKLNVENYKSGIYIYEYNGISNKFVVK